MGVKYKVKSKRMQDKVKMKALTLDSKQSGNTQVNVIERGHWCQESSGSIRTNSDEF